MPALSWPRLQNIFVRLSCPSHKETGYWAVAQYPRRTGKQDTGLLPNIRFTFHILSSRPRECERLPERRGCCPVSRFPVRWGCWDAGQLPIIPFPYGAGMPAQHPRYRRPRILGSPTSRFPVIHGMHIPISPVHNEADAGQLPSSQYLWRGDAGQLMDC